MSIIEVLEAAADPGRIVGHTVIWGKPYTWWIRDGIVRLEPRITDGPEHITVVYP